MPLFWQLPVVSTTVRTLEMGVQATTCPKRLVSRTGAQYLLVLGCVSNTIPVTTCGRQIGNSVRIQQLTGENGTVPATLSLGLGPARQRLDSHCYNLQPTTHNPQAGTRALPAGSGTTTTAKLIKAATQPTLPGSSRYYWYFLYLSTLSLSNLSLSKIS